MATEKHSKRVKSTKQRIIGNNKSLARAEWPVLRSLDASVSALFPLLRHSYAFLHWAATRSRSAQRRFHSTTRIWFFILYFCLPFSGFTCSLLCDDVFSYFSFLSYIFFFFIFFTFFGVSLLATHIHRLRRSFIQRFPTFFHIFLFLRCCCVSIRRTRGSWILTWICAARWYVDDWELIIWEIAASWGWKLNEKCVASAAVNSPTVSEQKKSYKYEGEEAQLKLKISSVDHTKKNISQNCWV